MKYKSFRIQNFKGIKDTTVELQGVAGASVFAFVGLNESGKTTILEAIHSFSPDNATSELLGGEAGLGVPFNERVPRHLISEFTGNVSVIARLTVTPQDKALIARGLSASHKITINSDAFPDEIGFERKQTFVNGDFKKSFFTLLIELKVKGEKEKKWRDAEGEERTHLRDIVYTFTPDIAYFPTFVFDFPEIVFLTERGGVVDKFYRRVFQDILDYDGRGHTIEKDIIGRVRREGMISP